MARKIRFLILSCCLIPFMSNNAQSQPDTYEPIWHCTGADSGEQFGFTFTSIDDQNNDGCSDMLITNSIDSDLKVYLFYGGDQLDTIPDLIFDDPSYMYYPPISYLGSLESSNDRMFSITTLRNDQPSILKIYYGGDQFDTIPEYTICGETIADWFGSNVATGDMDNNGYNDFIVSAPSYSEENYFGKLYLYYGSDTFDTTHDLSWGNINLIYGNGSLGVTSIGDINEDGYDDVITIGGSSKLNIFYGGSPMDSIPDMYYEAPEYYGLGGGIVMPDLNGDDVNDLIVNLGSIYLNTKTYIFYGGANFDLLPDDSLIHYEIVDGISYAGDVNADGYGDIITSQYSSAEVEVYFGGPHMPGYPQITIFETSHKVGYFGDVNGDGVDDFGFNANLNWPNYWGEVLIYSDTSLAAVSKPEISLSVAEFTLHQNYPNPFNTATTLSFNLLSSGRVSLKVFDITGREVQSLVNGQLSLGKHSVVWNAEGLACGVYLVRLSVDGGQWTVYGGEQKTVRKVVLVK